MVREDAVERHRAKPARSPPLAADTYRPRVTRVMTRVNARQHQFGARCTGYRHRTNGSRARASAMMTAAAAADTIPQRRIARRRLRARYRPLIAQITRVIDWHYCPSSTSSRRVTRVPPPCATSARGANGRYFLAHAESRVRVRSSRTNVSFPISSHRNATTEDGRSKKIEKDCVSSDREKVIDRWARVGGG